MTNTEDYKSYLKWINNLIAAPALLYIMGFLFIQGAYGPLLTNEFFFSDYLTITPVSLNLYLFNGIFIAPAILGALIIAWLILHNSRSNEILEKIISFFYKLEFRFKKSTVDFLAHLILLIIYSVSAILLIRVLLWITLSPHDFFRIYLYKNLYFFYIFIYFILFLMIFSYLKFYIILIKVKLTTNHHMNLMYIALFIFILIFTIYFQGLHTQSLKTGNFIQQKGTIELATVTMKNGVLNTYIYMDTSSDYFIGYDLAKQSTEIIVKDSIETITIKAQRYAGEKKIHRLSNETKNESTPLYEVINTYYRILLSKQVDKEMTEQYTHLFSNQGLYSPELYQKQLINETYRNKNEKDFYGIEFSIAEEFKEESKSDIKKSDVVKQRIYVREIWKNTHYDLSFIFISKDKGITWSIEDIENTYFSFKEL